MADYRDFYEEETEYNECNHCGVEMHGDSGYCSKSCASYDLE